MYMEKGSKPSAENLQDTVELDVEAIFRACDEAAAREAAEAERPGGRQIREVFGSGRLYRRDDNGEEVVLRLDKWS
jgi:hypothetical protein